MANQNKNVTPAQNRLYWFYLVGFFLILFTPVISLPPWFSPPDWGKTVYFRIIFSVIFFVFICQLLYRRKEEVFSVDLKSITNRKSSIFIPFWLLVFLLGVYFLATVFSLDIRYSLLGNPYRAGGFINFAFFILFSIIVFFILKQRDWRKFWNFGILVGIFVSVVALINHFRIFPNTFIPQTDQITSTLGGPTFLGLFLLLLSFITLSFGFKEQHKIKKVLYFLTFVLFAYIIALTISQAAYLGLAFGLLYFFFFYPKKLIILKSSFLLLIILTVSAALFIKSHPENRLNQNYLFSTATRWTMDQSRLSAWKIAWQALIHRPILGYGPENFSIGFDKYYDPSLPQIAKQPEQHSSWWDRGHNFVLDNGLSAGIPAIVIFILLFAVIFWRLQKIKKTDNGIIAHGLQATFVAYFIDDFFSFDTLSIYLILFLLVIYSIRLIAQNNPPFETERRGFKNTNIWQTIRKAKNPIAVFLFVILLWFIWSLNIKPFNINTRINMAQYWVEHGQCDTSFKIMDSILDKKSTLDSYLRLKYADYLRLCESSYPGRTLDLAKKGIELIEESAKIQPLYIRNWIFLVGYNNVLIEKETNPDTQKELIKKTESYLEKAYQLSPNRQELYIEWTKTALVSKNFAEAKEKAEKCVSLNENLPDCYWFLGLTQISLGNPEEGKVNVKKAGEMGYNSASIISLSQLANSYSRINDYQDLSSVYEQLTGLKPNEPQYHASLAFSYRGMGQYEKARKEAMKVLELQPEAKDEVEAFLKTLP